MTLPLRSCSNCAKWSAHSTFDKDSGTLVSACALDGVAKRGSDKCSRWARKVAVVVAAPSDEDWMYFG